MNPRNQAPLTSPNACMDSASSAPATMATNAMNSTSTSSCRRPRSWRGSLTSRSRPSRSCMLDVDATDHLVQADSPAARSRSDITPMSIPKRPRRSAPIRSGERLCDRPEPGANLARTWADCDRRRRPGLASARTCSPFMPSRTAASRSPRRAGRPAAPPPAGTSARSRGSRRRPRHRPAPDDAREATGASAAPSTRIAASPRVGSHGLSAGISFLQEPFTPATLLRKVR